MKVGIIGAGQIVCDVLPHLDKVKGFNVNAICATKASKEKLVNLCSQFSIGEYYLDVDEMLEKADIDTVYVAVPNVLHYIFCKKALEKGKKCYL